MKILKNLTLNTSSIGILILTGLLFGCASPATDEDEAFVEIGNEAGSFSSIEQSEALQNSLLLAAERSPTQSPNDSYDYRFVLLPNQIRVLLISDGDAEKGAAAMNVHVGSGDNPEGRGGLAHFLEHMLFLGTDKYPDAGEYGRYISEHGGSQNAFTNFEHTNYFFDVEAPHLAEALDRFAQFFISPRFDAEYVDREKNAVEAEYRQGLKNDGRRGLDVLQEVMNPAHPYSQIAVGNLETLADRPESPVRDELIAFYETWYTPDRMALVVFGPQKLDTLEELVRDKFEAVGTVREGERAIGECIDCTGPDATRPQQRGPVVTEIPPMFLEEDLPILVQVEPRATRRTMQVSFPVGEYRQDYDVKPTVYVGNLVGHEGKGSLLSALKAEGLAEGLNAGSGLAWRGGSLFSVTVSLTEKGVAEYRRVLKLLFGYIDMLREKGAQQWLYEEGSKLADLRFRFLQHGAPMGYVTSLSTALHYYSPDDVLRGPYAMDRYDAEMIDGLVEVLRPENALVVLTHEDVETDRVSKWYEVPYSVEHAGARHAGDSEPENEHSPAWRAPAGVTKFTLPAPNAFIPDDVSLVETSWEYSYLPVLLLEQDLQSIWFGQDDEFKVPKGGFYVNFRSPLVAAGPRETAEASMFVSLLKDELNEFTYPALLAGLGFSFYAQPWGISMRITGYNDKQNVLLQELLGPMRSPALDRQRFEDIRDRKVRGLQNRVASRPSGQAMARLNEALLHKQWSDEEMIAAYQAMSIKDVQAFVEQFWAEASAEVMVYGNYQPEIVGKLSNQLGELVGARHAGDKEPGVGNAPHSRHDDSPAWRAPAGNRVTRIPARSDLLLPMEIEHDDSVVAWYMQASGISWKDRAMAALSAQIMKSEFFRELRTEQQLGYTASAFVIEKFDVPGLVMLIQSPVADAPKVSGAMDKFLDGVESYLDEPTFKRHQKVLIGNVTEPDKNLWERAEYYWQSMANKRYEFDGREKMVDALKNISHEEWQNYFDRVFMEKRHSLKVIAPGKWSDLPEADRVFDSAAEIKTSFDFYEFP